MSLVPVEQQPSEIATVFAIVARAAADPSVDMDKLERLMAMQERAIARQNAAEYAAAFSAMQSELPSIGERGELKGRYTYALWEDINAAIKPVLQKHGFSLSFRMETSTTEIKVTGILSHSNGHREETTITLAPDMGGNKPLVQAVASSVSYGKRYTASALLNLTTHGEDDDAFAATRPMLSDEQQIVLQDLIDAGGVDKAAFLKYMNAPTLAAIELRHFGKAKTALTAAVQRKGAA